MHAFVLLVGVIYFSTVTAVGPLYNTIYRTLDADACVRLLDKNGPIGCTTPEGGTFGELHVVRDQAELEAFYNSSPSEVALAIAASLFNKEQVNKLYNNLDIRGVLLLYGPPYSAGWSPDTTNPNSQWGLNLGDTGFMWNPSGDSLNFVDLPFPVYALSEDETQNILQLATNDTSYPRTAIQFNSFMHASQDAATCLRRGLCIPLGGKSVWSAFNKVGTKPIIMAMANIDSNALFHDLATGADSTVSGIVGLLGAVLALQNVDRSNFVNDLVFSFWAAESWGYIGSRKFLTDIQNFSCLDWDAQYSYCRTPYKTDLAFENIDLENIVAAIEVNQIGNSSTLYIHQEGGSTNYISSLLQSVSKNNSLSTKMTPASNTPNHGVPPSSIMSFLMANPALPSVVITDHDAEYKNMNYHSHLDNGVYNSLSNTSLCDAATILAQTLYLLATNQTSSPITTSIQAPCDIITELIYCLSVNFTCDLVTSDYWQYGPTLPSYYTGIFGWTLQSQSVSPPSVFVFQYLFNITAYNTSGASCADCTFEQLCFRNVCVSSETHYHDAISNAFAWDDSNGVWTIVDDTQPTWVESNWGAVGAQIFLRASPTADAIFLTYGVVQFLVSLVGVYYARRYFFQHYRIL